MIRPWFRLRAPNRDGNAVFYFRGLSHTGAIIGAHALDRYALPTYLEPEKLVPLTARASLEITIAASARRLFDAARG